MTEVPPETALSIAGAVPALPRRYTRIDMHRDFKRCFASDEGRRVMGHILAWSGLWAHTPMQKGLTAAESALVHEGRRTLALAIMQWCEGAIGKHDEQVNYGGRLRKD